MLNRWMMLSTRHLPRQDLSLTHLSVMTWGISNASFEQAVVFCDLPRQKSQCACNLSK